MIDTFKVKADATSNKLLMQLRGYFMKSELELAFYLARREIKKLSKGYEVLLDFDGMHTDKSLNYNIFTTARRIFFALGAGKIKSIGISSRLPHVKNSGFEHFSFESVGIYPN